MSHTPAPVERRCPIFMLRRIWLPLFIMAGISILSGTAGPQLGPMSFTGVDKTGHFVIFGLLGVAWARCLGASTFPSPVRLLLATGLTVLFGLADEIHQRQTPGRYFEWADLVADFLGALCWTAAYLFIRRWRAFLELELWESRRLRFLRDSPQSR